MEVDIEPTKKELLAIIGLLWMEADSLRQHIGGGGIHFNQRLFSNEEIIRGGHYVPKVSVRKDGAIIIQMES